MVASKKVLLKEGEVTRSSILEYVEAMWLRYVKANKREKGKMLDEFVQITRLHRKAAIRLLRRENRSKTKKKRGRKKEYGPELIAVLEVVWEASNRLCSKRLQPFIPEMVRVLRRKGELQVNAEIETQLCRMSSSTIDRLLKPIRKKNGRRGLASTKPGNLLKNSIPIRTFADWNENKPGFMEIDLVAHCGDSLEGSFLYTLCAVDVASGWTECLPVKGKTQIRVRSSVHRMRLRIPFDLLGVDSDNGSEFINHCFITYCDKEGITFTKSRPYKKNDSCYVEQKNGNVVRQVIGYDRYTSEKAYQCLDRLYLVLRLYINFFQPTMKLISKTRYGTKVHKIYDSAKTPYQRLLDSGTLSESKQQELTSIYTYLNPVHLLKDIHDNQEALYKLADSNPNFGNRNYDSIRRSSVTV